MKPVFVALAVLAATPCTAYRARMSSLSEEGVGDEIRHQFPASVREFLATLSGGSAVYICTGLANHAYSHNHRQNSGDCGVDFALDSTASESVSGSFLWHSFWRDNPYAACLAPDAYFTMCVKRLEALTRMDPFSEPEMLLTLGQQDDQDRELGHDDWRMIASAVTISKSDPTAPRVLAAAMSQIVDALNPEIYDQTFPNVYHEMMGNGFAPTFSARDFQASFREFIGGAVIEGNRPGYGARVGPQLCEWVPSACEGGGTRRPGIDLGPDRQGWRAPGSELEQPPWNHWPEELSDELLSEVMFSLQAVLVQHISASGHRGWEQPLSVASRSCAEEAGAVYILPTAFLKDYEVRPGYLPYGVDMHFGPQRELLAMFDAQSAHGEPSCWHKAELHFSGATAQKWAELKLLGMAAVMAMQPYIYHAVEKVAFGGVFWTAVYGLPPGHPVRDVAAVFAHRSLEKANEIMDASLGSGDFFRLQTAFSVEGWEKLLNHTLGKALHVEFPTGTPEYWTSRGLSESQMPIITFGSQIRAVQRGMIVESLAERGIPAQIPPDDRDLLNFEAYLRSQWPATTVNVAGSRSALADLLSEAMYRMSVTHTQTHHHQVCHGAMANPRVFPFQLTRGPTGRIFPMSHRHLGTMMIWDAGTEPAPKLDFPLVDTVAAAETDDLKRILRQYHDDLLKIEQDTHDYNRKRCDGGVHETSFGCLPYSCMMPKELMMSYGV